MASTSRSHRRESHSSDFPRVHRGSLLALGYVLISILLFAPGQAWSAAPAEGTIRLPGPEQAGVGKALPQHPLAAADVRQALARELVGWTFTWDPADGGILSARGKLEAREAPAAFAARLVAEHAAWFGMGAGDLQEVDARTAWRLEHRYYRQSYRGITVEGSRLNFAFARNGSPLFLSARTAPGIELADTQPSITLEGAQVRALDGLPPAQSTQWDEGTLVVLPRRFSGLGEDRLAWRLRCHTAEPHSAWRILVDAHTGELLERESLLVSAGEDRPGARREAVTGQVEGWIHNLTPFHEEILVGYPHQKIDAYEGETPLATTFTDAQGMFDFGDLALINPDDLVLRATMAGPYAVVVQDTPYDWMLPELRVTDPELPATMTWDSAAALPASRAVFFHINTVHDYLKGLVPSFTFMDQPVLVFANDSSDICNAYASLIPEAPQMNFFSAGGPCPDIAEIADVVYHEYTHLVTMYAYLPEWGPGDLHEAFSDYFATTVLDTSAVGLDFYGPGTQIRNMDNDYVYPREECNGEVHCVGEVMDGALWHMRQGLIDALGDKERAVGLADSLVFFMRAGRPMSYEECLVLLLLQDDDDGDLSNGTPHLEIIAGAFERHTIGDFDVHIVHTPLYDTEDPTAGRAANLTLSCLYPVERDSVLLHYSADGLTYTSVTAEASVVPYHFSAVIPAQPMGTKVSYYLTAVDESGRRAALPEEAPEVVFDYMVGTDVTPPLITHALPGDPAAGSERLWFWMRATDNIGLIDSARVLVSVSQPESRSEIASVDLYLKDEEQHPGLYEGFLEHGPWEEGTGIAYHFEVVDGSSQHNVARYPATGELALETRRGQSWDFEVDPADLSLTGDWEWGVTHVDPAPAPSGSQLAGTVLDGYYASGQVSDLTTVEFDLSTWERAMLEFRSWYWTEDEWDGGRILASRDHGMTWEPLTPAGGYPSWIYDTEMGSWQSLPAFAGEGREWQMIQVPLDDFVGGPLQIRFHFYADGSVVRLGWYLDDIKVVASQALVAPERLWASEGEDGLVHLDWAAPDGVNTASPEFEGYLVYRTDDLESAPNELITTAPLPVTEYVDAGVVNGVRYRYAVTAAYASGESPLSGTAIGYPYRAEIEAQADVEFDVEGTATRSDTLLIANSGTGDLRMNLCLGDPEDSWTDLIPQHNFDSIDDEDFTLLAEDPAGAPAPDLKSLECMEVAYSLALKIALHDSLPNPYTDFTMLVYLDTDLSRETGLPYGDLGSDYFFAMGTLVYQQSGTLAFLLRAEDAENVDFVAPPTHLVLEEGLDSLEVAAPLPWLGFPERVGFAVRVVPAEEGMRMADAPAAEGTFEPGGPGTAGLSGPGTVDKERLAHLREILARVASQAWAQQESDSTGDQLPDARELDWLHADPLSATATPEDPLKLALDFDFTGREPGDLAAKLFIASNDLDHPLEEVPITAHVWYLPPEGLAGWATTSRADGLLLEWSPADPDTFDSFLLHRWGDAESEEDAVVLGRGPITAPDDSLYHYVDRGVESGRRYYYRLAGMTAAGDTIDLSPTAHPLYSPPAAVRLAMEVPRPNPFRSTTAFRIHAPEGSPWDLFVVDVTGRMVRYLVREHESRPGVHLIQWDGVNEKGARAAQGVYYAVARGKGGDVTRSLVLIR